MSINDFKPNPDDITSIDGIDISEGCPPSNMNDAVRHVMSNLHDLVNKTDVTQSTSGWMSSADKIKLDSIEKATQLPKESGVATIGTSNKYATEDHVHPIQTSVTGNAGTATKLQTARSITLSDGAISTPISFDGSSDITLPVTQLDSGKLQHLRLADTGTSYIKTLYDVCMNAWIGTPSADSIGALKITLPVSWSTTFFSFDIELIKLSTPDHNSRIHIEAYSYGASSKWIGQQCDQLGKNYRARLGHDGEKCCILIGNTTHTWSDFVVIVHKVTCGYNGYNSITRDGWSIDILKDDSTITAITEPIVNKNTTANKFNSTRTISLTGDLTGTSVWDGSNNLSIDSNVTACSANVVARHADQNTVGMVNPVDQGLINISRACRTAFMPANGIKIEHSTNGTEWIPTTLSETNQRKIFAVRTSSPSSVTIGPEDSTGDMKIGYQTRITVSPVDRYCIVNMMYVWISTGGHDITCDIEYSTIGAKDTFTVLRQDVPVTGWGGPNVIYFPQKTFGGDDVAQLGNGYSFRFTFKITKLSTTHPTTHPSLTDLRMYGPMWHGSTAVEYSMPYKDSIFDWDVDKNVIFPATVYAPTFSGNATSATKLATARTISLTGDVTGSTSFDGSGNVSLTTVVADDSHNHTIDNVDSLQTTLDSKASLLSPALTGTPTAPTADVGTNTNQIATTEFVASTVNNVSLAVTKLESLPNTRAEILAKNTDFTVPSYKVGSNTLMVFINGVHGMAGEDATLYAYKEMGTVGTMSTTIQFHDDIAIDHSIFAIVFGLNI